MTQKEAKKLVELASDLSVTIARRDESKAELAQSESAAARKRTTSDLKWAEDRIADLEKKICALACSSRAKNPGRVSRLLK